MTFVFDVLTLFPPLLMPLQEESLLGKARREGVLDFALHNWREWATDRHRVVDDAPFGGGPGMVLKPDPVLACLRDVRKQRLDSPVVLLSPGGTRFDQATAQRWSTGSGLILLCGRYEGFDARIEREVDAIVSIGDFVLNGGEVAAMAIIEAVARLLPGVVGNAGSLTEESHTSGLLEYPHYTRPRDFEGQEVPEVLMGGNHAAIALWRRRQALLRTAQRRPDLLASVQIAPQDAAWLAAALAAAPDPEP